VRPFRGWLARAEPALPVPGQALPPLIADTAGWAVRSQQPFSGESVMSDLNWEQEQQRFMDLVYPRTLKAAKRAFSGWHSSKIDDVTAELVGKVWDSFFRLRLRGRDPEPMVNSLIRWGVWWCRYDRKISGRARRPDVYDYRANMHRQLLSEQGVASTSERSSRDQFFIDFNLHTGDDPSELASALEETGLTLGEWLDL
jgi:hypothetical protein